MTRQGGVVEQIGALLDEGCAPDEIGVLLAMDEHEVRRIAQLLDERGPADPAPDVDVQAVAAEVEALPDVDGTPALYADDVRPLLGEVQGPVLARAALVTIADHVDHLDDVRDLASMLGLGPALDDWAPRAALATEIREHLDAVDEAVDAITPADVEDRLQAVMANIPEAAEPVENHAVERPGQPGKSGGDDAGLVGRPRSQVAPAAADTVLDGVQRARQRLTDEQIAAAWPGAVFRFDDVYRDEHDTFGTRRGVVLLDELATEEDDEPVEEQHDHDKACDGMVCACGHLRSEHRSDGCVHGLDRARADAGCPCPLNQNGDAEHVHDVGPAWDEDGTPYALCATCGHRWDRQTCEVCGLNVTGLVIAGAARHPHHDLPNTRKD